MKDKDKAAFEVWYEKEGMGFKASDILAWQAALSHRDAQVAGLVEALRDLFDATLNDWEDTPAQWQRKSQATEKAETALAEWEYSK